MILFLLLAGHALCDFSLQTDYIAKNKSHKNTLPVKIWPYVLASHAIMHGGAVAIVTGSVALGCAETFAHASIDFAKTEGFLSFHTDQAMHILCKIIWAASVSLNCAVALN